MPCSNAGDRDAAPPIGDVLLVPLEEADLDTVVEIERESFANPWRRGHFLHEMTGNRWAVNYAARRGEEVLGYASVWHLGEELKINNIAVRAECRRRGLGRWMLLQIMERARRAGCRVARLEVRQSNVAARKMYERHGFVETGRRKGYYAREQEDAILMDAPL